MILRSDFVRVELSDTLICAGGAANTVAVIRSHQCLGDDPVEVLAIDDEESLTISVPQYLRSGAVNPAAAAMRAQRIARVVMRETATTQVYREYRGRSPIISGPGQGGISSQRFDALILDLARCGPIVEILNGLPGWEFDLGERTATSIAQFIVDAAVALGVTWLTLGVVDATIELPQFTLSRATPLAAAQQLRDALRSRDIPCELRLERVGNTGYTLNWRSEIGAGTKLGVFTPRRGLLSARATIDPTQQTTKVAIAGAQNPDGETGIWGRARFAVANVTATGFDVHDPAGGADPIQIDLAFMQPTPAWWVRRVKTGESWQLALTLKGPPAHIEVATTGSLQNGELVELSPTAPSTNDRYIPWQSGATSGAFALNPRIFEITAIDTINKRLTIAQKWDNSASVVVDGQFDGWRVLVSQKIAGPVAATPNQATNTWQFASVAAFALDDWVFPASNTVAPYLASPLPDLISSGPAVIDSIDAINNRVHVVSRSMPGQDPVVVFPVFNGTRVFRALRYERVRASLAASDEITVDSVSGITVGDAIQFDQPDGAGEIPNTVAHPLYAQPAVNGYDVQVTDLTRPEIGVRQIVTNGFLRAWAGAMADGWTKTGLGVVTKNTTLAFVKLGPNSAFISDWRPTNGVERLDAPRVWPTLAPGRTRVSVRAWFWFTSWSSFIGEQMSVVVSEANPDGTRGLALATASVGAPDDPGLPPEQRAVLGGWMSLEVKGLDVLPFQSPYGLIMSVSCGAITPGNPVGYFGGIEAYGHTQCPVDAFENGDAAAMLQAGNRYVRDWALPQQLEVSAVNFGSLDPARRLDTNLGALMPVVHRRGAIDAEQRLVRLQHQLRNPTRAQLTLARRSPLLTDFATP